MAVQTQFTVAGRKLALSNLDKVLYPKAGFTKGQVIDYYARISACVLPHLKDRALTLKRYPNGVEAEFFYEKRCPDFRPPWVKTAAVWSSHKNENIRYCLANDLATLVWAANLADLELHTSLAKYKKPDQPTMMVFDLDPGPGATILDCAKVSIWLRDLFDRLKLKSFVKTSGSKGLQVYVPLNTTVTFDQTKAFAHALADEIAANRPDEVVSNMSKQLRAGKIFIDWSQNDSHKTTVCVYSLRAKEQPTVSTPLKWSEVEAALKSRKAESLSFEAADVIERAEKLGDLFADVLKLKQKLPKLATSKANFYDGFSRTSRTTSVARLSSRRPRYTG
jgi:bifunctional non-homologous end joining protein LigD